VTAIREPEARAARGAVPYEALGRPITGPSALTGDWARFWHLTFNTAFLNWKLRFFGSALGYLWQLVRPLLLFAVLYVFFTKISHVDEGQGPGGADYGSQLLGSIVLFTFFAEATGGAVRSVVDAENMVRKIHFPRLVIPLSVVLLSMFNLGLNLIVVTIFALIEGVRPMLTWLEVPLLILVLAVLSTGVAMLLSSLFVYFRDLQPIWEVITQILFYGSPVIVPITKVQAYVSPTVFHIYMLSPLSAVLQQFRHAFITHATPAASTLLGSQIELLEPVGIVLAIFALGFWVFRRTAPRVAEDL
jgi:ABC-2 type transport system permease protein